jgi:hypothetical protein
MSETALIENTYHAFYKGKQIEIQSDTSYHAQLKAAGVFRAKKSHQVTVVLVAVGERQVTHTVTA